MVIKSTLDTADVFGVVIDFRVHNPVRVNAMLVQTVDVCPDDPEDTAEQYLLHSLSTEDAERFEEHYMVCGSCAAALSAAEDYISSIRTACLRLAKSGLHLV